MRTAHKMSDYNRPRKTRLLLAAALCGLALGPFSPVRAERSALVPATPAQRKLALEAYHQMGLRGDRSQITPMLHALQANPFSYRSSIIMLALARLGAVEAIPTLDDLLPHDPKKDLDREKFIRAIRARILAETEPTPQAQAARFFQELGKTPGQISTAVTKAMISGPSVLSSSAAEPYPRQEVCAEEQLADMIYHGPTQALLADPLVSQIDFSRSYETGLKVEMAQLSPEQQRHTLVERLAHSVQAGMYESQLLIDLGHAEAVPEVSSKLAEMGGDSKSYPKGGFYNLFLVLCACQDIDQASALLAQSRKDPDLKIRGAVNLAIVNSDTLTGPGMMLSAY